MESTPTESANKTSASDRESSKSKPSKTRGKKRKRISSDSSSDNEPILPDNAMATDRNLHASALKNNLDDKSVRKILKKVVTNDHVLALVQLREEEEDSGSEDKSMAPVTRAKVKQLKKVSKSWNLETLELVPIDHIPVKTRPEVTALIAHDLPEDEDDEEYQPTNDDVPSDDDHGLESCSDLDSQPRTPAAATTSVGASPVVHDGPFKVPQDVSSARRKLEIEEEATIALRTRSKLSLSSTSIEHIESTFVPPDDLPMVDVDDLWNEFLNECLNPASTSKNEDDDEADPEYNVAADPDANDEDEGNPIIKISKKEITDLVNELFSIIPEGTQEAIVEDLTNTVLSDTTNNEVSHWEGKQEPVSDDECENKLSKRLTFEKRDTFTRVSIGKTEIAENETEDTEYTRETEIERPATDNVHQIKIENVHSIQPTDNTPRVLQISIDEQEFDNVNDKNPPVLLRDKIEPTTETVHIKLENSVVVTNEQILILQQQLRQHIQLATSNFLQLYVHPIHWTKGPIYKDYLVALTNLADKTPNSVVNVCNLKPALELVTTWEKSVSVDNEENREMIEFVSNEIEKSTRRFNSNSVYLGDFHETFKKVVANSPVFLYPYLLPATPYREFFTRRSGYLQSEDELIVLCLDQFWRYLEANPSLLSGRRPHARARRGLRAALALVVKHALPWATVKQLAAHVAAMRVHHDKHNPIAKYFRNNELNPVQHKILPFNPKLTLYEQPEHEMPRIWVRYLAKTSKRFKSYLYRRQHIAGQAPDGIPIQGVTPETTVKTPLPIDFTKEIPCYRSGLKAKVPEIPDKYDIQLETAENAKENEPSPTKQVITATNVFRLVKTSTGPVLLPLEIVTNTVNSTNTTPALEQSVTSKVQQPSNVREDSRIPKKKSEDITHCTCCVLLRKICRKKQTYITDYFSYKNEFSESKCYCNSVKHKKITNKLKLLVTNFKNESELLFNKLEKQLEDGNGESKCEDVEDYTFDEFASVTSYQVKVMTYCTMSKRIYLRHRIKKLLSKFDIDSENPIELANELFKIYDVELMDLYLEFIGFLTPAQADEVNCFKDYFVRNCAKDLMDRIDKQVTNKEVRLKILTRLKSVFSDNKSSACEICTYLLENMMGYETLAQYTFSLFPHRKEERSKKTCNDVQDANVNVDDEMDTNDVSQTNNENMTVDYEADNSSNDDEEEPIEELPEKAESDVDEEEIKADIKLINKTEERETQFTVFLEEDIKTEPQEWKRDEDKLILELLQQQLTPEERKHNDILEMLEEINFYENLSQHITSKTIEEIKCRVTYLLSVLIVDGSSEKESISD